MQATNSFKSSSVTKKTNSYLQHSHVLQLLLALVNHDICYVHDYVVDDVEEALSRKFYFCQ